MITAEAYENYLREQYLKLWLDDAERRATLIDLITGRLPKGVTVTDITQRIHAAWDAYYTGVNKAMTAQDWADQYNANIAGYVQQLLGYMQLAHVASLWPDHSIVFHCQYEQNFTLEPVSSIKGTELWAFYVQHLREAVEQALQSQGFVFRVTMLSGCDRWERPDAQR